MPTVLVSLVPGHSLGLVELNHVNKVELLWSRSASHHMLSKFECIVVRMKKGAPTRGPSIFHIRMLWV